MVLESIIGPLKAERKPWEMLFLGFLYASVGMFLAIFTFPKYSSLAMVFFTVIACVPLMYNTLKVEEAKDLEIESEKNLLKQHFKAINAFLMLFCGMTLAFSFWYVISPFFVDIGWMSNETLSSLFRIQLETITSINSRVTGMAVGGFPAMSDIFLNNIKVMVFCVAFSFLYGAGAIFILAWNASIIGAAIGNTIRTGLGKYLGVIGIARMGGILHASGFGIIRYAIHGIPEILAYIVGGVAGGIISVAIINHDFGTRKFEKIILDASDLLIIAIMILLIAAILEVYVTPAFSTILRP